jgi:hypothetical protein
VRWQIAEKIIATVYLPRRIRNSLYRFKNRFGEVTCVFLPRVRLPVDIR